MDSNYSFFHLVNTLASNTEGSVFTMKWILIVICFTVLISGTVGNVLVLILVAKYKQLRTISNAFVVVLAVTDLNACVVVTSAQILMLLSPEEYVLKLENNIVLCILLMVEPYGIIGASLLSLACLAVERCIAVYFPFHHSRWLNKTSVSITIASIFIYAAVSAFLPVFNFRFMDIGVKWLVCPNVKLTTPSLLFTLYGVWVPALVTIVVSYGLICSAAYKQAKQINITISNDRSNTSNAANVMKSIKVFAIIALCIVLDRVPKIITFTLLFTGATEKAYSALFIAMLTFYTIGNGLSAFNPWFYVLRNKTFKYCFDNMFAACKTKTRIEQLSEPLNHNRLIIK